jgi:hypothetical protein
MAGDDALVQNEVGFICRHGIPFFSMLDAHDAR